MMAETFRGIDLEWMRAQWRDCADKDAQLTIFKDMTGERKAVILHALGEDPEAWIAGKTWRKWTPEEEARLMEMKDAGRANGEIADALGREVRAVNARIGQLRKARSVQSTEQTGEAAGAGPDPGPDVEETPTPLTDIRAQLEKMDRMEKGLLEELSAVRAAREVYRRELTALLAMAGGALGGSEAGDAEP